MKPLRKFLDKLEPSFTQGRLKRFFSIYEMIDTFLYTTAKSAKGTVHLRDGMDLKRMMVTVAFALIPCVLFSMYNVGYQANTILNGDLVSGWRGECLQWMGISTDASSFFANFIHGALYFIPVFLVTNIVGGIIEVIFATIRGHEINEGFLVTGLLFPLTLPPTIPLWQVALGIGFGVLLGKEIFGGTGKNFLNPALTARAFLFFAYPAEISGDGVWLAVDGVTKATPLLQAASGGAEAITFSFWDCFIGLIPGSMGETSTLACIMGALVLLITGIGSWRIMLSMLISTCAFSFLLNIIDSPTNPMFSLSVPWHLVSGGFAFGLVFMATDPVSASMHRTGQFFYGALIGMMVVLVRVINPAFPEGTMLAILFANCFSPLIDHFFVEAHIKRRRMRNAI